MTAVDIIDGALTTLDKPQRWCRRVDAQAADGGARNPQALDACRWCLRGAMERELKGSWFSLNVTTKSAFNRAERLVEVAIEHATNYPWHLTTFNDRATYKDVRLVLERAREMAAA